MGQRVQRDPAHLVQGPSPDECRGDRLLALPDGRDRRDGCSHGHPSAVRGRRRKAGSGLQVGDRGFEDFVHEAAERPVVEREGLLARIRGFEAEPVPPDEAERVTEQLAQRTSGVDAPEHGEHDRMVRAYASVVGRETGAGPRIPAACGGRRLSGRPELLRPCHQAVDLADGVVGDAVPAEMGFVGMIAQERALPEQAAIGAAPRAREDDRLGAGRENGGEVAAVGNRARHRIEDAGRHQVIRQQPVLGDDLRPAPRTQPEQADEPSRGAGQGRCRCPDDRGPAIGVVVDALVRQRQVDDGG